ncbi:GNAT family N-acetyltransferase [Vibrio olivae]|uniref:GNAT family N-acetyltransferase n=1 Tax=Vibrio olivae TaxID=1243002 RepID=A0ABV5HTP8_9VIBR
MTCRHLKLLSLSDAPALFEFEKTNRTWFEQHIPPREPCFYSIRGVEGQIAFFLREYKAKRMLPFLIMQGEDIIGRVNVTEISVRRKQATLGYRIGERHTRQGVASYAAKAAMQSAQEWGIRHFYALASVDNMGSQRVLEKVGFERGGMLNEYAEVSGESVDCIEYYKRIDV